MTLAPDGHEKNCDIFQLTLLISDLRLQKVVLLPTFKMLLVSYIERACENRLVPLSTKVLHG